MPTYIMLGSFTDQGVRAAKDTTKRAQAARDLGKKVGVTVRDVYWTLGQYDVALVAEAPDDETMTAFGLSIGSLGNVRTQTLRAFTPDEMGAVLGKMKK
jgi:uncharacterized protein with GYD domain